MYFLYNDYVSVVKKNNVLEASFKFVLYSLGFLYLTIIIAIVYGFNSFINSLYVNKPKNNTKYNYNT